MQISYRTRRPPLRTWSPSASIASTLASNTRPKLPLRSSSHFSSFLLTIDATGKCQRKMSSKSAKWLSASLPVQLVLLASATTILAGLG